MLRRGAGLVGTAVEWYPAVVGPAFAVVVLAELYSLKAAGPLGKSWPGPLDAACATVAAGLLLGLLARHLAGPAPVSALIRRGAQDAFRWRSGRVVDVDEPGVALVEVVARAHWGRKMLNSASDVGFLRVEPGGRAAWFEGDFERYHIPAGAIVSCELETPPRLTGMPEDTDDATRLVVVRAHHRDAIWEAPFYVRHDGTPGSGTKTRRQLAEGVLRRLRGVDLAPDDDETAQGGTPAPERPHAALLRAACGWIALLIMVCGVSLGPFITYGSFEDIRVARLSSARPRPVRVEDLGDAWPGDNPNVTLTDFEPLLDGLVRRSEDAAGPWTEVYVPLIPKRERGRPAPGKAVRVILRSVHVRDEVSLRRMLAGGTVSGVLKGRGDFFGPLRAGLEQFNPGIDTPRCWTLIEGIAPRRFGTAVFWAIGGTVLFALAACILARGLMCYTEPQDDWFYRALSALGRALRRCEESPSPVAALSVVVAGSMLLGVFASLVAGGYFSDPGATLVGAIVLTVTADLGAALVLLGLSLAAGRRLDPESSTRPCVGPHEV